MSLEGYSAIRGGGVPGTLALEAPPCHAGRPDHAVADLIVTAGGHTVQQAVRTEILVNLWPVPAVTIANQRPVRSLYRGCLREAPRPRERNADDSTVDERSAVIVSSVTATRLIRALTLIAVFHALP